MAGYQLSVCAEMVFLDLPFVERVARIHALGFGVEIWNWENKDLDALMGTGARFTSMTGYLAGNLTDDEDIAQLLQTAELSLAVAQRLNCPSLNLHGTGLDPNGLPVKPVEVVTGAMWLKAADTLGKLAQRGERAGKVFTLENLNLARDHPGTPFAKACDTLALVEAVNSPGLKMNLDLYHAQIGEGNLIELIRRCGPAIGEIQVADVPGRQQPGTGEINYRAIARALDEIGYRGVVALEGWASDDSTAALQQFRDHFTL
ncbi:Hydroxypyruvate isomerase [Serratia plymuthica]|nr:Hydroxypyruvate isomerase [Serratia plymuthica]